MIAAEFPSDFQASEGSFHVVSTRVSIADSGFQIAVPMRGNMETVNHPGRAAGRGIQWWTAGAACFCSR